MYFQKDSYNYILMSTTVLRVLFFFFFKCLSSLSFEVLTRGWSASFKKGS